MNELAKEVVVVTVASKFRVIGGTNIRVIAGALIVDGNDNYPLAVFALDHVLYAKTPGTIVLREGESAPGN